MRQVFRAVLQFPYTFIALSLCVCLAGTISPAALRAEEGEAVSPSGYKLPQGNSRDH